MSKIIFLNHRSKRIGVLVDEDDFSKFNKFKWFLQKSGQNCYAFREKMIQRNKEKTYMHREVLKLKYGDGKIVDHVNRNGLDNRKSNLCLTDKSGNGLNRKKKGLGITKHSGGWMAQIKFKGKHHYLGHFKNKENALIARKKAEIKLWKI